MARTQAEIAEELRLFSFYEKLDGWMDEAREEIRLDTAEGAVAEIVFDELFALKRKLEPVIERLARREAEREAEDEDDERAEAEEAADRRRANPLEPDFRRYA